MAIQKKEFGVMPSGEKVYEYTLTNKSGVSASFIELGATWTKMLVPDRDGNMADVILGYDEAIRQIHLILAPPSAEMQTVLETQ
jgi:aldose 1-epimerase